MRLTTARVAVLSVFTAMVGFADSVVAAPPRFVALGNLSGGPSVEAFSVASDVSADGTKVVGLSKSATHPLGEAFVWTSVDGMVGLSSLLPAGPLPFSSAAAISRL